MLSPEEQVGLNQIVVGGALAQGQDEITICATWRHQRGTCPICGENVPWHRGILFQRGLDMAWVCLLCTLLSKDLYRNGPPRAIGVHDPERQVPLPPNYACAWVNGNLLPRKKDAPLPTAIEAARQLGHDSTPAIWAAIIEDPNLARLKPPSDQAAAFEDWLPVLIYQGENYRNPKARILSYAGSEKELKTSHYIHQLAGVSSIIFRSYSCFYFDQERVFPLVDEQDLLRFSGMTSKERYCSIPRVGVVEKRVWQSISKEDPKGLAQLARIAFLDEDFLLYLVPFSKCDLFYSSNALEQSKRENPEWYDSVGFDIGEYYGAETTSAEPLWQRVFGNIMVPE